MNIVSKSVYHGSNDLFLCVLSPMLSRTAAGKRVPLRRAISYDEDDANVSFMANEGVSVFSTTFESRVNSDRGGLTVYVDRNIPFSDSKFGGYYTEVMKPPVTRLGLKSHGTSPS